ncbi:hypothetical protein EOD41_00325 [Mucilaginibacter limnophilus]|uniref:Uncharacterized protein n=1 Tax=Mucilaginibacter limnophilus TaxID=1932778 RepID=A0A437MXM3_9SPHI|nr:hypothetical protein [Mucilaginibacter limnophilus]RVU02421.1 hypothetical protein EOD41_00325 [Mucilaginibacter limnophilus]
MKQHSFTKYYRVFKHDTHVTEISVNDFLPVTPQCFKRGWYTHRPIDEFSSIPSHAYTLPVDAEMFCGYTDKIKAMEKAKAGALNYINLMIKEVETGINKLKQYRNDHYDELNINLTDASIRRLEKEMNIK